MWLANKEGFAQIDTLAKARTPFLFIISYDKSKIFAQALDMLNKDICYRLEDWQNETSKQPSPLFSFSKYPVDFLTYRASFEKVLEAMAAGNTYLLNLTFKTPIETSLCLKEIFDYAKAKFKLYVKDEFVCFSPEPFIEITHNTLSTYPMKGTIDARIPEAKEKILSNEKERAEHVMIVDLMRNDLSIVASDVRVEKFAYVDKIQAGESELLQVSSKITATLQSDWQENFAVILDSLLPAGSISGTPKKSTLEIIDQIEDYERGFYTGVFGVFDGDGVRSSVMIRFIEKEGAQLVYKSGGGITVDADVHSEYRELIDKIYLPL